MNQPTREWDESVHKELLHAYQLLYHPLKIACSWPIAEPESTEYVAHSFQLNGLAVAFRCAKITPKKIGAFVTLWKRINKGPIQPWDASDNLDLFIVSVRRDQYLGHFIFTKDALLKHGILSQNGKGGKRAIRVYPPWDKPTSAQAQKTQTWQLSYFLKIPEDSHSIDFKLCQKLYRS